MFPGSTEMLLISYIETFCTMKISIHCVYLEKLEWSKPDVSGTCPPPLAAHGSAVVGTCLYMFGGWSSSDSGLVARDVLHCLHTGECWVCLQ